MIKLRADGFDGSLPFRTRHTDEQGAYFLFRDDEREKAEQYAAEIDGLTLDSKPAPRKISAPPPEPKAIIKNEDDE